MPDREKTLPKSLWWVLFLGSGLYLYAYRDILEFRPLLYDDPDYLNPPGAGFSSGVYWKRLFTTPVVNLWHPLTVFSHNLISNFADRVPWGHHGANLILHFTNAVLIAVWLRFLKATVWVALVTALIWLLHPTVVESTSWVSGRKDLLGLLFTLGALIMGLSPRRWILLLCCAISAMLSKPTAIMLPCLLIVQDMSMRKKSLLDWRLLSSSLKAYLPIVICSLCVVVLTLYFQAQGAQSVLDPRSFLERATGASWALWKSVKLWVWPHELHISYNDPVKLSFAFALSGAALLALICFGICSRKTPPVIRIGLGFFLFFLFPTLGFVRAGNNLTADRYLYFSGVGLTMIFIFLLSYSQKLLLVSAALISILFSHLAWQQRQYWRTTESLFQRVVDCKPNHSFALSQLGALAKQSGNHDEAKDLLERALVANDQNPIANLHLGDYSLEAQDYRQAYEYYVIAAKLRKADWLFEGLAKLAWNFGEKEKARSYLEQAYPLAKTLQMKAQLDQLSRDFSKDQ